jgi:GDP-4-dehydro-6-deoxy-D-mannose reductase
MQKHVLVTGVNGFVGPHLVAELKKQGAAVTGVGHSDQPGTALDGLADAYLQCDLTDEASVENLDLSAIDAIIHLAALSNQGQSFAQPKRFIADNSAMVINLMERILKQRPDSPPRVIIVSSGSVYDSRQDMPLTEDSRTASGSPYAVSKLLTEDLADYYKVRGIDTVVVRPFTHVGPGQGPGFLLPDLARQLKDAGEGGTVKTGNLKTLRDYSDVRDFVRAYALLALRDEPSEQRLFNLCSGVSRSGEDVLNLLIKAMYGGQANVNVETDPAKIRPNDPPEIYGDNSRLKNTIGWEPQIPFEQTVTDFMDWFKKQP